MAEEKVNTEGSDEIVDEADFDKPVVTEKYAISSFGIDFDVEGLLCRLRKDEIFVPYFQRNYVWKQYEASQFVESLLLGLPVPGVFLAKEQDSQRLLIIDGQQRLKTLQFFYDGFFKPDVNEKEKKVFSLIDVQPQFVGKTYESLDDDDRRRLDNSVIHATIIKQETPDEVEDTSLFYIFGRLNSGGRKLNGQEIRAALYYGPLMDAMEELNQLAEWRKIFGKQHERLKDQELILRFLSLYFDAERYKRPMEEFINKVCMHHQKGPPEFLLRCKAKFIQTIQIASKALGAKPFRPVRAINAAVFDSVMVGIARRLDKGPLDNLEAVKSAYQNLLANNEYINATSRSTADEANLALRLRVCTEAFGAV